MQQRFFLYRFFLWLIGVPVFFDFWRIRISQRNSSSDRFFIVDTELLLAVKDNQLFIPAALEIFDRFQIFFQLISNGGLGRTLTVLFCGLPEYPG